MNPLEDFSERWDANHKAYEPFKDGIYHLREKWQSLLTNTNGLPGISKILEDLFGEKRAQDAIIEQTKALGQPREDGRLGIKTGTGLIVINETRDVVQIPRNNFYGD